MSAITGIYRLNGQVIDDCVLQRMTDILAHRGPDASHTWHHASVGLGHRMLWTTPESLHERLPLISDGGRYALTADARIDNRDELIAALDPPSNEPTDTELILHAYQRCREHCPEYLIGDFAFALWDEARRSMFCARDHIGVKPLYYYQAEGLFAFASEIKALLSLPMVPQELNEVSVASFLAQNYNDRALTSYQGILRLPAAHTLTIRPEGTSLRQYWAPDVTREIHFDTDEEYEQAFCDIFTEAVRCRLRSAFPVGSQLSGGLDSSAIVGVARHLLRRENADSAGTSLAAMHTFSVVYDETPEEDERPYIDAVLAVGHVIPHFVHIDQLSPLADVGRMLWHHDEPYASANWFPYWALFQSARKAGIRVLLDGVYGDQTVGYGEEYLVDLVRQRKWHTMLREAKSYATNFDFPLRKILWRLVVVPSVLDFVPPSIRIASRKIRNQLNRQYVEHNFIRDEFSRRIHLLDQIQVEQEALLHVKNFRKLHYGDIAELAENLRALEASDKTAAGCSIEIRYPFLDRRLIEFCVALPPAQRLHHGWTRSIARRSLSRYLPVEIQKRNDKAVIAASINRALLLYDGERIKNALFADAEMIEPYVNVPSVQDAYHRFSEGGKGSLLRAWRPIILALWLQRSGLGDHGKKAGAAKTGCKDFTR